jgi:hypothetical protein
LEQSLLDHSGKEPESGEPQGESGEPESGEPGSADKPVGPQTKSAREMMAGLRAMQRAGSPVTTLTIIMLVLCMPGSSLSCVDRTTKVVMSALVLSNVIELVLPQLMKIIDLDGIHDINESTRALLCSARLCEKVCLNVMLEAMASVGRRIRKRRLVSATDLIPMVLIIAPSQV